MQKEKENPFGLKFEEMDIVMLIHGLLPKMTIAKDNSKISNQRRILDSPTDANLAKN